MYLHVKCIMRWIIWLFNYIYHTIIRAYKPVSSWVMLCCLKRLQNQIVPKQSQPPLFGQTFLDCQLLTEDKICSVGMFDVWCLLDFKATSPFALYNKKVLNRFFIGKYHAMGIYKLFFGWWSGCPEGLAVFFIIDCMLCSILTENPSTINSCFLW